MGRPPADDPLSERVLVRMNVATREALRAYVKRTGQGEAATAMRMILIERLRAEGLLK